MTRRVSIPELAGALACHESSIKRRAARELWPYEEQPGRGRQRLYELGTLPVNVQLAFRDKAAAEALAQSIRATQTKSGKADALSIDFDGKPENLKKQARERLAVVVAYQTLRNSGESSNKATEDVARNSAVCRSTLMRYLSLIRGQPEHLWLFLLAPRYAGRAAKSEMSAEAWEVLKGDYLRLERPAASACIDRLRRAAKTRPDWSLPSTRTMTRRLNALPRATKLLSRQGTKALQALYPPQQRSRQALRALEIINGDGYKHNVWVRFPDGDVVRAKTWFWQDVYSAKILAWRTDKSEHTEMIRLAFGDLVEKFGIPDAATIDNTMAAANKTMSGGIRTRYRFKVQDEEPDGVFKSLGCDVRWATPGHGQAKPVERAFGVGGIGEVIDKAPEFSGAWTGADPLDKPEYDGRAKCVELAQLVTVIQREIDAWNARPGRKAPLAQGRSFDELFEASYKTIEVPKATVAQRRFWLLAAEPVRAHSKDGSIALETGRITRTEVAPTMANRYWAPAMIEYAGKKLTARFDPQQLHVGVHIYAADGRYVCFADCHAPQGFNDANAAREHARDRRAFMRSQKEQLAVERRMTVREAVKHLQAAAAGGAAAAVIPAAKMIRPAFGHPMERPAYVPPVRSPEQRAADEQWERDFMKPVKPKFHALELREKWNCWMELDRRRAAGEALDEEEEQFHLSFQQDPYFRHRRADEEEFERRIAAAKQM